MVLANRTRTNSFFYGCGTPDWLFNTGSPHCLSPGCIAQNRGDQGRKGLPWIRFGFSFHQGRDPKRVTTAFSPRPRSGPCKRKHDGHSMPYVETWSIHCAPTCFSIWEPNHTTQVGLQPLQPPALQNLCLSGAAKATGVLELLQNLSTAPWRRCSESFGSLWKKE